MENLELIPSLNVAIHNVKGLQARADLMDRANFKILAKMSKKQTSKERKKMLEDYDTMRLKSELILHIETLLEVESTVETVVKFLVAMHVEGKLQLDFASSTTISFLTLSLITEVAVLLSAIRNVENIIFLPALYSALDQSRSEDMKIINNLLAKYRHPIQGLMEDLMPCREMLVPCVLSCEKVLRKTVDWSTHLLTVMLQSSSSLTSPDEFDGSSSVTDVIQPIELARVAFFGFLVAGMPWNISNQDDLGGSLLKIILTENVTTIISRNQVSMLHATLLEFIKRGKDKQKSKKLALIKHWEEEANKDAFRKHDERRKKLSLLMEEYLYILEDAPVLLGPKFFLILTIIAQSTSEIKWYTAHQHLDQLSEGQDLEPINLIYHVEKIKSLVGRHEDVIVKSCKQSISYVNTTEVRLALQDADIRDEDQAVVVSVLDRLAQLARGEENPSPMPAGPGSESSSTGEEETIMTRRKSHNSNISSNKEKSHLTPNEFSELLVVLSGRLDQSSSIGKKLPQLSNLLEFSYLNVRTIADPSECVLQLSDLSFIYFFKDFLHDSFRFLLESQDPLLPCVSVFPQICQNFPNFLNEKCPEEYKEVLAESFQLANFFLEEIAACCRDLIDRFCRENVSMSSNLLPENCASFLAQKKKKGKKKKQQIELDQEQKKENTEKKEKETKNKSDEKSEINENLQNSKRLAMLERLRVSICQLLGTFFSEEYCIQVASQRLIPRAYLTERIGNALSHFIEENMKFPTQPSHIWHNIQVYLSSLQSVMGGVEIHNLFRDCVQQIRDDESISAVSYIDKYMKSLIEEVISPNVHFSNMSNTFLQVDNKLQYVPSSIDILASYSELTSLIEVFGPQGVLMCFDRLEGQIKEGLDVIISVLNSDFNSTKTDVLEPAIKVGKLLRLVGCFEDALSEVSRERVYFLWSLLKVNISSEESFPLINIFNNLGNPQWTPGLLVEELIGSNQISGNMLIQVLTALLPLISRLQSSRYHLSTSNNSTLDSHENSIECFALTLSTMIPLGESLDVKPLLKAMMDLDSEPKKLHQLSTLLLAHSFLSFTGDDYRLPNYNLIRSANTITGSDRTPSEMTSLHQELSSKKVLKFLKEAEKKKNLNNNFQ